MKTYKVNVNGKTYEVTLETVSESNATPVASAPVVSNAAPAPTPAVSAPVTGGAKIVAPIGGKLISLNVKVGDTIKINDVIGVIEAMKLENEVPSPVAGKVKAIVASVGNIVNNGDVLVVLE